MNGSTSTALESLRPHIVPILVCSAATVFTIVYWARTFKLPEATTDRRKEGPKKPKDRKWGAWTPETSFRYPPISPHSKQEVGRIEPIAYRPFKWGEYKVTMGIRTMPWDEWIELDNQFINYHNIKLHRLKVRKHDSIQVLDRNELVESGKFGAIELVHELAHYLPARYPGTFKSKKNTSGAVTSITIIPLSKTYELPPPLVIREGEIVDVPKEQSILAMEISALLLEEDIAIMVEGSDGGYFFQAGAICLPGFWRMKDKIGRRLEEIHTSGNVPEFREKLQPSLERFFRRMAVDKPVIRNNYFVQVVQPADSERRTGTYVYPPDALSLADDDKIDPDELAWSYTALGLEDHFLHHTDASSPQGHIESVAAGWSTHAPSQSNPATELTVNAKTLRLRSERQTLRRLPISGAIVFGIHTYIYPMEDIADERDSGTAGRLASAIKGWSEDVSRYKGKAVYGDYLVDYLESEQEKAGAASVPGEDRYPL